MVAHPFCEQPDRCKGVTVSPSNERLICWISGRSGHAPKKMVNSSSTPPVSESRDATGPEAAGALPAQARAI
jgi:hypothetical protein